MNNLTTRKIVLGLLMTLVLAFGVPGVVDAIMDPTIDESALNPTDLYDVGGTASIDSIGISPDKADTKETVSISKSSGITLTGDFYGLSSVSLKEVDEDLTDTTEGSSFTYTRDGRTQTISGTATGAIGITFTTKGKQTVTISGTDNDGDDKGSWSYKYTYYVKGPGTSTTTISLVGLSNGYKAGIFSGPAHRIPIHNGDGSHYDVTYTTIPDNAMAQIETTAGALGNLGALHNANTSSVFDVLLQANRTYQVTATVKDSKRETIGVYIIGTPNLTVGYPDNPDGVGVDAPTDPVTRGSKGTPGRINEPLSNAFKVRITDGSVTTIPAIDLTSAQVTGAVPGVVVTFRVGGGGDAGGYLVFDSGNQGTLVYRDNRKILDTNDQPVTMDTAKILYVRTDKDGQADVDFQLGTNRKQDVTISAVGQSKVVSAYAGAAVSGNQLVDPESKSSQASGHAGEYELRVKAVDEDGEALSQYHVEFRTSDGTLDDPSDDTAATDGGRLPVQTDTQGIAFVFFDPTDSSDSLRVTAHLLDTAITATEPAISDTVIDVVVFDIGGTVTRRPTPPAQQVPRLAITTTGEGATRSVTVNALTAAGAPVAFPIQVTLGGTALVPSRQVNTGTATEITLPTAPGDYTLIAVDPGGTYTQAPTVTITVAALGTLSVAAVSVPVNGQQTIEVTVRNADGTAPSGSVTVTLIGAVSRTVDTLGGSGRAIITLPTTATYTLTLSAPGYTTRPVTLSTTGQPIVPAPTPDPTIPIEEPPAAVPSSIQVSGPAARSGTVNQQLDAPLLVRVLDDVGTGVADARVIFRVISGRGKLSERGNGRAVGVQTDSSGYARANFTPTDDGTITVRASTTDISATVTFTITSDDGTPVDDGPADTGEPRSTERTPVVHVGAASRPPMLWVEEGAIYALVGASPQRFAPSVDNALNLTVAGGKVYWTEKTGESGGTINSANLNGSGVTELASIFATPMGIAVDTDGSKLYWTNSSGRIQSANLDGSRITNELQNLASPMDIALAGGNAYWTQGGNVRFVNLRGQKVVRNVSTGMDTAGSLAIGGGKVYWTEKTGESGGTVNSANLNGTGATQLASILAAPSGIAVDTARSKLYWTNARGRVQSANLDGSKITNVVSGLGSPGELVLSNSIAAPVDGGTSSSSGSGTTASNKYDVNGDGSVDSMDVDALIVAVAAGVTDAKYDVNGDGKVDIFDVSAVSANRDEGAASAPTLLGTKLSIVQIDRLQEQIDLLIASNDRSPDTMRILIYLQQLIVMARPEKTQLLANYPNPFNPETWIPYELATDTNVKITIYNTQGVVIRSLQFGHQSAGYYVGRDRAAYWDGRNAFGEQVASGLYFYQLETDDMSSMRKMVILK